VATASSPRSPVGASTASPPTASATWPPRSRCTTTPSRPPTSSSRPEAASQRQHSRTARKSFGGVIQILRGSNTWLRREPPRPSGRAGLALPARNPRDPPPGRESGRLDRSQHLPFCNRAPCPQLNSGVDSAPGYERDTKWDGPGTVRYPTVGALRCWGFTPAMGLHPMPRAGWLKPQSDQRLSDHVSLGVLTSSFQPRWWTLWSKPPHGRSLAL